MKRHIFYFLSFTVVLSAILIAAIYHPSQIQALSSTTVNAANSYCSSIGDGQTTIRYTPCFDGYIREIAGESQSKACPGNGPEGADQNFCVAGWQGAKNKTKPGSSQSILQQEIAQLCTTQNGTSYYNSCSQGVTGESKGKTKSDSCQSASDQNACTIGWTTEQTRKNPTQVSAAAQKACSADKSNATNYTACIVGQESGTAGDATNAVCNEYSGQAKTDCQSSWTAASNANNSQIVSQSPPTCDSSGISLAFIMCPIITGLADASDKIYSSIIQPLLVTAPVSLSSSSKTFGVWSNFRTYGDIFLIIALLVVIFGESIGGGLIDAYSAKKILPRLLVAAVLINLSIYLVAIAVDVTNVVGGGIAGIIEAPFQNAGAYSIQISGGAGDLGMAALVTGGIWALASIGPLLMFLFVFFLVPAFLTLVAILVTVFLRQGIIILLVMISPVAFALYCLPNTERYFKQWWDLLFRTLLVYPIIAVVFAMANVLSVVISSTSKTSGMAAPLVQLMAMIALFVPLFLIPFSFRIAGGVIGKFSEFATTARKRAHEAYLGNEQDPWSRRSRAKYGMADRNTRSRERVVNWSRAEDARFGVGRRAIGRAFNTGNLQAKRSRFNRERAEIIGAQYATGDDSNLRDLFIAWDPTANDGNGAWFRRMDMENGHAIPGAGAIYKDKGVGQMAHNKSLGLYKGDQSSIQEGLFYEWKKTGFEPGQMSRIENQYSEILDEVGLNTTEGVGVMKGVGFRHAPQSLVGKYSTFTNKSGGWNWQRDYVGLSKEASNNYDLYGLSRQDRTTFNAMGDGYEKMRDLRAKLPKEAYTNYEQGQINPNYILGESAGPEFSGKSAGQIDVAMNRLERLADAVNPGQRGAGGPVLNVPDEEGGQPIFGGGMQGISNAPVDVQQAATEFYKRVRGRDAGTPPPSGGGPRGPVGGPSGTPPQRPGGGNVSSGGVILP